MWYNTIKRAVEAGTANAIRQVLDERSYRKVEYTDVKYATQKVFAGHEVTIKGEIGIAKEIDAITKMPDFSTKAVYKTIYVRRTARITRTDHHNPITGELIKQGEPMELEVKIDKSEQPFPENKSKK